MAKLPYAATKTAPATTKASAMQRIIESYRRKIKAEYPKAQFDTEFVLGVSIEVFVEHLESFFPPGMTWENYGKWKVMAVRPPREFDFTVAAEFYAHFNYQNFRPQWAQPKGFVADPDKTGPMDVLIDRHDGQEEDFRDGCPNT